MTLSTAEICTIVDDIAPRLEGGRIERIDAPQEHTLVLRVRRGKSLYWLLLCAHPRFSRLHLLTRRPEEKEVAGGFVRALRQHLTGAPLIRMRQAPGDRVVVIESARRDAMLRASPVRLVAELVGIGSNLILVAENNTVLAALHTENSVRRVIQPGAEYVPLPAPAHVPEKSSRSRFADVAAAGGDPLALSRAVADEYHQCVTAEELEETRCALAAMARAHLQRLESRREKLEKRLAEADGAEDLRRTGELLKIALPRLRKGDSRVTVEDLFREDGAEVTIALDPRLAPEENMRRYFSRYKKLKRGRGTVAARLNAAREEIVLFRTILGCVESATTPEEIEGARQRALEAGLAPPREVAARAEAMTRGPRVFLSCDGLDILVARSREESRELTFSIARGNDYWLHLRGWPGPHVVVHTPAGGDVSLETLLDAGHLAIHYSRLKGTDFAEVTYTRRKHVRQLKGAAPGTVSYSRASTLQIRFDSSRLRRILASRRPFTGVAGAPPG